MLRASVYPAAIKDGIVQGLPDADVTHRISKHLQQVIKSDHFRLKQMMPKVGCLRSSTTARRTIAVSRRCCGCAKASASPATGALVARMTCLHPVPDFKRLTKPENRGGAGIPATTATVRDQPIILLAAPTPI